jgi:hypothetical protein
MDLESSEAVSGGQGRKGPSPVKALNDTSGNAADIVKTSIEGEEEGVHQGDADEEVEDGEGDMENDGESNAGRDSRAGTAESIEENPADEPGSRRASLRGTGADISGADTIGSSKEHVDSQGKRKRDVEARRKVTKQREQSERHDENRKSSQLRWERERQTVLRNAKKSREKFFPIEDTDLVNEEGLGLPPRPALIPLEAHPRYDCIILYDTARHTYGR